MAGVIATQSDVEAGERWLSAHCTFLRKANEIAGPAPLRREPGGFAGLSRIVVGQMLSTASANAIWLRLAAEITPFTPAGLLARDDDTLKRAGLSVAKIRTLRVIASRIAAGELDLDGLAEATAEEVGRRLTALPGVGPWTADVYGLFCLGHADGFAAADLALQVAAQDLMELDGRPSSRQLAEIAERWRPWRGVAARMLWTYYRHRRGRAGI